MKSTMWKKKRLTTNILSAICNVFVGLGYTLATIMFFLWGLLFFQVMHDNHDPLAVRHVALFGVTIRNPLLAEYLEWGIPFTCGYFFILLLCPKKYKIYVATICVAAISVLYWICEPSREEKLRYFKPDYGIWPFLVPLVIGFLIILLTSRKDTAIYHWFKHKDD